MLVSGAREGRYQHKSIPTSQFGVALQIVPIRIRIQNLGSREDAQEAPWNTYKLKVL